MERKKRSIVLISLALLSTFTIVGSGFAVWNFSNDEGASTESMVSINVENYIEIGKVTITSCPDSFYIESDNDQYANYGGLVFYSKKNLLGEGQLSSEFDFRITPKVGYSGINLKKEMVEAKLKFEIKDPLSKYFEMDKESANLNKPLDFDTYDEINQIYTFDLREFNENGVNGLEVSPRGYLSLNRCFKYKEYDKDDDIFNKVNSELASSINKDLINLTLTVSLKENWEDYS